MTSPKRRTSTQSAAYWFVLRTPVVLWGMWGFLRAVLRYPSRYTTQRPLTHSPIQSQMELCQLWRRETSVLTRHPDQKVGQGGQAPSHPKQRLWWLPCLAMGCIVRQQHFPGTPLHLCCGCFQVPGRQGIWALVLSIQEHGCYSCYYCYYH